MLRFLISRLVAIIPVPPIITTARDTHVTEKLKSLKFRFYFNLIV